MDKYEINFDNDLDGIKKDIISVCRDKPKLVKFFSKLMLHINNLIDDFSKLADSDVSSDEMPKEKINDSDIENDCNSENGRDSENNNPIVIIIFLY